MSYREARRSYSVIHIDNDNDNRKRLSQPASRSEVLSLNIMPNECYLPIIPLFLSLLFGPFFSLSFSLVRTTPSRREAKSSRECVCRQGCAGSRALLVLLFTSVAGSTINEGVEELTSSRQSLLRFLPLLLLLSLRCTLPLLLPLRSPLPLPLTLQGYKDLDTESVSQSVLHNGKSAPRLFSHFESGIGSGVDGSAGGGGGGGGGDGAQSDDTE